jgi:hypothetical protein
LVAQNAKAVRFFVQGPETHTGVGSARAATSARLPSLAATEEQ